ncbi:hypothetical protein GOV03_03955 [Candidatus Woesearchaeota archaeon]|nr:hypothetical protein [Candidatus Woesearchaeota archaeon]
MEKRTMVGLLALVVVGLVFSAGLVSAYQGDYTVKGPNYSDERHGAMEDTFETLNYDEWYELMTEDGRHPRVVDVVTESNFVTFVEAHEAAENGDYETAAELRAELGLNDGNGPKDGTGFGKSQGRGQGMQHNNDGLRQGKGGRYPCLLFQY